MSQYLDLLPVAHPALGWIILARQNQPMAGGLHPWLGVACTRGTAAFCTDGWQFFGVDHRLSAEPRALRRPSLPSRRLQYEFALAGLQSRMVDLRPRAVAEIAFVGRYLDDHPAASTAKDAERLTRLVASAVDPASEPAADRGRSNLRLHPLRLAARRGADGGRLGGVVSR